MQPRDPRAFLWDAAEAARAIEGFTAGMDADSYANSALVNAAVGLEDFNPTINRLTGASVQ
jgi:uncharacterized protein with HEPN domain